MKWIALCLASSLATCCPPPPAAPSAPSATTDDAPGNATQNSAASDTTLAARRAFTNQGGMWLPRQMTLPAHADAFAALGAALPSAQFSDPLQAPLAAVVSLGGCTGSFVSPDGLVVTNHHCVQQVLQHNSTPEANLVENGFLAKTLADEKSAGPAQRIMVATASRDVTIEITAGLGDIEDPALRVETIDNRSKSLIAACEANRPGMRCQVHSFFRGAEFQLIESLELRDVRLVYSPHRAIGNYGGEIDNWAWPRHTGDFAFLRAYVGPDGQPADFAANNIPYKPAHWLRVNPAGVRAWDMVLVAGYPGKTERTKTAAAVEHDIAWTYPTTIEFLRARYALVDGLIANGGDLAIKAGVAKQSIQNAVEKMQGIYGGLKDGPYLEQKRAADKEVRAWAAAPGREATAAQLAELDRIETEQRRTADVDFARNAVFGGSRLLATAFTIVRMAEERPKPDAARKPGFQERDRSRLVAAQKAFAKSFHPELDRANFRLTLARATALEPSLRPWLNWITGVKPKAAVTTADIDKALTRLYAKTRLTDEALRLKLLEGATMKDLKRSSDPFIKLALRLWPVYLAEEKRADSLAGQLVMAAPAYAVAMREARGGLLAPDANSTLRVTYGTVRSFVPSSDSPADRPFTTASQLLAKATGKDPFDAPAAQQIAIREKRFGTYASTDVDGELPVNFVTNLDTTGGNSGSPTLNSRGEFIGIGFDGTIDRVASDVVYRSDQGRTIHCDVRYMLWVMDIVDGADRLLTEMGLTPTP